MTVGESSKNLPWVEKYRPSKLEDLVSHDDIIKTINQFMKENQLPHLLFYGPPGTGKTSTILACAKKMYTPQQFNSMVLELNASDDRGIGIVRGQILNFASTRTMFKAGPKLIILDEADAMTNDAQNALRRKEEVQSRTVKITFVGEPATGKSALVSRYLCGAFGSCTSGTRGAELRSGQCGWLRPAVPVQLCDVAGLSLHTPMLDNYLYASDIIIFVYDLTNLQSFEKLDVWVKTVKKVFEAEPTKPLLALFGNKSDLEHHRAVRLSSVQRFASEHLLENYKGSARTGEMVNDTLTTLIARLLGVKVHRMPADMNGRSPAQKTTDRSQNGHGVLQDRLEPTQSLIMSRKALRNLQKKSPSSVLIEKYTENVRFCIICNYLGKIIPALQSRCTRFRFAPLNELQIVPRLKEIVAAEGVEMTEDGMQALLTLSGGDMRKVLNALQSTWLSQRRVTEHTVYTCLGHPLKEDINAILNWLLNQTDFSECYRQIQELKISKGLALSDILTEIHTLTQRVKLPPLVLTSLWMNMAESEARLAAGASERLELAALVAVYHQAREHMPTPT